MNCDRCGKEIKSGDKTFSAVGMTQCEECNVKSNGTISLDLVLNKIMKEKSLNE